MEIGTTRNGTKIPYKPQQAEVDFIDFISRLSDEDLYDAFMIFQVMTIKMKRHQLRDIKDWY